MERTVFLHVGMAKAGSTSIQRALASHRMLLADHGYDYPDFHWNHSRPLTAAFSAVRPPIVTVGGTQYAAPYADATVERIRAAVVAGAKARTDGHVILSGETLQRFTAEECRALRKALLPEFERVKVVFYVRHPVSWANSRAQFSVRRYRRTIASMTSGRSFRRGSSPLVPRYSAIGAHIAAFGRENVDIRIFDRSHFVEADLMQDFCAVVGLPAAVATALQGHWENRTISAEAVEILDRYLVRTPPYARMHFQAIRSFVEGLPGPSFSLKPEHLERVWRRSEPEVDWLHETIGRQVFTAAPIATAPRQRAWDDRAVAAIEDAIGRVLPHRVGRGVTTTPVLLDRICDGLERILPTDAAYRGVQPGPAFLLLRMHTLHMMRSLRDGRRLGSIAAVAV